MRLRRAHVGGLLAALVLALLTRTVRADEELAVIVNGQSGTKRLAASELEAIFTGAERHWQNGAEIVAFNLPPENTRRVAFDRAVLHMTPEEVGRYWVDQRVRGGPRPPRPVPDPMMVMRLVARLPGGIGYVPRALAGTADVVVVARIRDGRVIEP